MSGFRESTKGQGSSEGRRTRDGGATAAFDPRVGMVFHGKYEVLERLGAGGFGTVYRVRNLRLDAVEALKLIHRHIVLDEAQVDRFRQEAQLLRRLGRRSPHIPLLHDFDRDEEHGVWFFTLEFVSGTSLRQIVARDGAISVPRALGVLRQVCAALSVAHGEENPVVHRDLKPDNIMVAEEDGEERVKILDFGIARILGETGFTSTQGGIPGSAGFIAPEQLEGRPDPRTDLFAAGVTLYEALTARDPWLGRRPDEPFEPGRAHEVLRRSLFDDPIPPREANPRIPEQLERIILRLLEKSPEDRFQSAGELDGALALLQSATGPPARAAVETPTRVVEAPPGTARDERPTRVVERGAVETRVGEERARGIGRDIDGAEAPGPGLGARIRDRVERLPGGGWSAAAALAVATLAGIAVVGLFTPGRGNGQRDLLPAAEVDRRLAVGEVEGASVGRNGLSTVRFADGSSVAVSWAGSQVGFQSLLASLRREGVPIEAAGEGRLWIGSRRAEGEPPAEGLRISVEGERPLCDPCPIAEEIVGPTGWYTVRLKAGNSKLDSALARYAAVGEPPAEGGASVPAGESVPRRVGGTEIFLPPGVRTDLTLLTSTPEPLSADSLAALLQAAEAAYQRGAWTSPPGDNVVQYVNRILGAAPTNRGALALRDSLARSFEALVRGAAAAGDLDRAREIAERCREAVPDATGCRTPTR